MRKVHLDQWQNAQKDTMVCKDLIFYSVKKNFLRSNKFLTGDEDVKVAVTEAVTEEVTEVSTQAVYEDNPGR